MVHLLLFCIVHGLASLHNLVVCSPKYNLLLFHHRAALQNAKMLSRIRCGATLLQLILFLVNHLKGLLDLFDFLRDDLSCLLDLLLGQLDIQLGLGVTVADLAKDGPGYLLLQDRLISDTTELWIRLKIAQFIAVENGMKLILIVCECTLLMNRS